MFDRRTGYFCVRKQYNKKTSCFYHKISNVTMNFLSVCCAGALQISDSQETDQGKYECVAENSVGTQHATAIMLWVRGECAILVLFFSLQRMYFTRFVSIIVFILTVQCVTYVRFWPYEPPSIPLPAIVRVKNKNRTRLKSHYFPFICCFLLFMYVFFFIHSRICARFFFFFNF